jgi:hypothetical protein
MKMRDFSDHSEKDKDILVLIAADANAWSFPSPARDLRVHELERDFEKRWGEAAPAWPARGRW